MKIDKVRHLYRDSYNIIRCPICHENVQLHEPASFLCNRGHCFDLSSRGYVNLMLNSRKTFYDKPLFESRRIIFSNGYFDPLALELKRLMGELSYPNASLVDVGCGEGYYSAYLKREFPLWDIYALDTSKEAIMMGAKQYSGIKWIIGNLANLPFQNGCMDIVMEVFAPANYKEFTRIIKDDGYILKVIPGEGYLKELRDSIRFKSAEHNYSNRRVIEYFAQNLHISDIKNIRYLKPVTNTMKTHFLKMTPLMFGKDMRNVDVSHIEDFTFDFSILIGQKMRGTKRRSLTSPLLPDKASIQYE